MSNNIKVSVNQSNINVRVGQQNSIKVLSSSVVTTTNSGPLSSINDVDTTTAQDNYIMVYDATSQSYKFVNPDDILVAAVTGPIQPGLPTTFVNALDNEIDLDAGTFQ
jgi:hypothetical protein